MKKITCLLMSFALMVTSLCVVNFNKTTAKATDGAKTYNDGIVPLTDSNINWSGRWVDLEDGSKQASFESYVEVKFTGTSIKVITNKSWSYIQVDGGDIKSKSYSSKDELGYAYLAKGLDQGEHTVRFFAFEQGNRPIIGGFKIDEGAQTLPVTITKRIEFIGDSITEGYCTSTDNVDTGIANNNCLFHSYSYKTGTQLNTAYDYSFNVVAYGGIGVVKKSTSGNYDYLTMPERYFKEREHVKELDASRDDSLAIKAWDTTKYTPDYIVINLGTNDSSIDSDLFKTTYTEFVNNLCAAYNGVTIFLMTPFNGTKAEEVREVVATINSEKVILIDSATWGIPAGSDDLHPAPAAHDTAAVKLYAELKNYLPEAAPEATIKGADLELAATLTINYYVKSAEGIDGLIMRFTSSSGYVTKVKGTLDEKTGYYKFSYKGINPQCMGDNIKAELMFGETIIDEIANYSVKTYCENQINKSAQELGLSERQHYSLRTLLADMLVYGSEAQKYMDYNKQNLADSDAWVQEYKSTFAVPTGVKNITGNTDLNNCIKSANLNMSNVNKICFRLILISENVKVLLNDAEVDKKDLVLQQDGTYLLYTDGILATEFDKVFTLTLVDGDNEISKVEYNVNAFIESKYQSATVGEIVQALNNYGKSAQDYLYILENDTSDDFDIEDEDNFLS